MRFLITGSSESVSSDWDICNTVIYDPAFMQPWQQWRVEWELCDQHIQPLLKFA